ncbi:uncharacterized protein F5891DRAFT_1188400 [Suillus fuscotomentosus]|uniref:CCL2-like lectin domain-containing protein n=1 Tax=Suillus fuscotomentosus TaxID=1912939 RepID=A0AAD4HL43_9AGAM|nr:uncharacterized protein F5891DRAFT_1188400 [Suillus fuscotomentosus]KAG1900492.1 hypothetical protein F5891DRAFT_1188400 [Suillus fuscotomentosus]
MTQPLEPGTYVIVNKIPCPTDERLAITYNGPDQPLTVNIRTDSSRQHWIVENYRHTDNSKYLVPVDATDFQAVWDADCARTFQKYNFVWIIQRTNSGYTIQDDTRTAFWGALDAVNNAPLVVGSDTGDEKHRWSFERVL